MRVCVCVYVCARCITFTATMLYIQSPSGNCTVGENHKDVVRYFLSFKPQVTVIKYYANKTALLGRCLLYTSRCV